MKKIKQIQDELYKQIEEAKRMEKKTCLRLLERNKLMNIKKKSY